MIRVPLTPIVISMVVLSVPVASARAADPDVVKIAQQLRDVADRLDELADFNKLGTNIPFTSFNPSHALELANLFKQSLRTAMDNALAGSGTDSCANLAAALDAADTTVGGVTISFDNVTHSCGSSPFSFGFDVHAQATVTPSLSVNDQTSGIGLSGGELSVTVTLDTTLNFQLDTSVGDPAQGFALLVPQGNAPKIEVGVNATGSITGFAGLAGIADVDVTGTAELDIDVSIEFIDPDDNGLLTIDELTSTSFADLVTVSYLEESGKEVNITLELDSTLIPGSPDASITLMHDDLSGFSGDLDAPGDVTFNLGNDLRNFLNTSPTEILSGLSSVAASIDAFQLISDVQVPFLDVSLRKAFRFVEPIQDFLRAQSDLAIACGTIDDNSPRGDISNLKNGEHFFCQATGLSNPVEFTWQLGANVVFISDLAGQTDPATIGTTPTKRVEFAMSFTPSPANETQRPDIEVDFRLEGDLASRTASRLFLSAEELLPKLLDLGGFSSDMTAPVYDSNTKTLTYHLKKEFNPDPLGEAIKLDFSDQLKEGTGLCGLGATAVAAAEIDAGPIKVEFTFGIILVEDVADITPNDPDLVSPLDRFFIQVRSDGGFELEADVTVTVNPLELKGRVGFLSVDVVGDAGANTVNSSAVFEVVRNPSNAAQPMLAIDIKPDPNGIEITGASTIMDAVLVTDLFKDLSGSIAPQFNISMSAGLMASANLATASGMLEAQIGIDLPNVVVGTWPDISLGTPTFTGNFDTNLQIFDTDPSVFGNATATSTDEGVCRQDDSITCHLASAESDCGAGNTCDTPTDTLTDTVTSEDFRKGTCSEDSSVDCLTDGECTVSASDECQAAILGRTLRNLTDGSGCVITDVVDADKIECSLGGGTDNVWAVGDHYEIVGNPLDLLSVILDSLDAIAKGIDDLADGALGAALSTELPLIGVSPEEIIVFVRDLESALEKIRSGEPDAQINCTWNTQNDTDRDPSNLSGLPGGKRCENSLSTRCASGVDCPNNGTCSRPKRCDDALGVFCTQSTDCVGTCIDFTVELMCNATIDALPEGDAVKSNVVWKLVHVADNSKDDPTNAPGADTVGTPPSATANFSLPDGGTLGNDFLITLEYETDKSGKRNGRIPADANSLQTFEELLQDHLGIPDNALTFELVDLPCPTCSGPDTILDLVIRLGFGECTRGNTITGIDCDNTVDRIVDQKKLLFGLGLIFPGISDEISKNLEGFVGLDEDGSAISLQYVARARLDLAIPLDTTFNSDAVVVIDTTEVTAKIGADLQNAALSITGGPVELRADAVAKMAAHFEVKPMGIDGTDNNETFSIPDFISILNTTLDGGTGTSTPQDCGDITVAKVITGFHDGADDDNGVDDSVNNSDTTAKGCNADGTCTASGDKDITVAQKGAELRKLGLGVNNEIIIIESCDSADFIDGALMCLKAGAKPKHCSETTATVCTSDSVCTNSANDKCTVEFSCAANSDCQSGEVCDAEDGKCKEPEFKWDTGDKFEIVDDNPGVMVPLEGDACALLKLKLIIDGVEAADFGEFGFKAEEIECVPGTTVCTNSLTDKLDELPGWYAHARLDSQSLLNKSTIQNLALKLIFKGMRFIAEQIESLLEGGLSNLQIPIIGNRFDGGSGLCRHIDDPEGGGGLVDILDELEMLLKDVLASVPDCGAARTEITRMIRFGNGTDENDANGNGIVNFLSGTGTFSSNGNDLLRDTNNMGGDGDHEDVIVTVTCDPDDSSITHLQDVRVQFLMGQGKDPGTPDLSNCKPGCDPRIEDCSENTREQGIDLDLSIPGVPFGFKDVTLEPMAGWRLMVDFGINRKKGPYIGAGKSGDLVHNDTDSEIRVGAGVALIGTGDCGEDVATGVPALDDGFFGGDTNVCAEAEIAFLNAKIRNSLTNPNLLSLQTGVDIKGGDGDGKIGFCELAGGGAELQLAACGDIGMSLRFRTEFEGTGGQLPNVLGHFNVNFPSFGVQWSTKDGARAEFSSLDTLDIGFDQIYLDIGKFFSGFMCPMVKPIQKATKPLMPIIDTVRTPIPLVSDLSQMVGGPKVTLYSLMVLANGGKPIPMIERLIELIEFIQNDLDCSEQTAIIGLGELLPPRANAANTYAGGAFEVDKNKALKQKSTPDKAREFIKIANAKRQQMLKQRVGQASTNTSLSKTPSSFSFPFLEDSSQIFGLLMGQDITLVRFDAGEMVAMAALRVSYCCIPVGPVPVSVFIEGAATLKGRFAMGYDTFGIRQAFMRKKAGAGTAVDLISGVFIDDLDASGRDVPEITLIGTVRAGAGVDIGFAAAGVDGGITLTVDFNLDDRPDNDGKLRLDEVLNKLSNPICLFDVSGKLEAFLGAWVRVGFEWFSKSWRFDILRITLLEFSAACSPPAPVPASFSNGILTVNMGSAARRKARNFNIDEEDEEVLLRQLTIAPKNGTATVSVTLMGFTLEREGVKEVIVAGDSGDDVVSVREGTVRMLRSSCVSPGLVLKKCSGNGRACADASECPSNETCDEPTENEVDCIIPFTVKVNISGGPGNDRINGGGGDDTLNGDAGDDKVSGGDGNDTINGGTGNDVLAGDAGNDTIDGGSGDDTISGGPDDCPGTCQMSPGGTQVGDILKGGSGDDDINGGPGTNELNPGTQVVTPGVSPDGKDWIEGGPGNDIIQGFFGDDTIYGDGVMTCQAFGASTDGMDKIDGGPGDDTLFGGGGDDTIGGEEGNDKICGNGGNDMLEGDALGASEAASGDDDIFGGPGHDQLFGRHGHDLLFGDDGNDALFGDEGPDDLVGGGGRDLLIGGLGRDILVGDGEMNENLSDSGNSILNHASHNHDDPVATLLGDVTTGQAGDCDTGVADCGDEVPSCDIGRDFFVKPIEPLVTCTSSADCSAGQFCILVISKLCTVSNKLCMTDAECNGGSDTCESRASVVNACANEVGPMLVGVPGESNETPNANSDCLFGGDESDLLFGEGGHDRMFGDGAEGECVHPNAQNLEHRDYMEGNSGNDMMRGGADIDTMFGNAGNDEMFGDSGDDRMFGCDLQTADCHGESDVDTMRGGKGDDYMEGNQDGDTMFGDSGQDDMVGGSTVAGKEDGADTMFGNADQDVMIGDNGTITRPGGQSTADGTINRTVTLLDLACSDPALAGPDIMNGNTGNDDMYGGCENDTMHGNQGDDYLEGNGDADIMFGDVGQDDMIGGTSQGNGGVPDGADTMAGGDGSETLAEVATTPNAIHDVLVGDNGRIERNLDIGGLWITDDFDAGAQDVVRRIVTLFDVATVSTPAPGGTSGNDIINGELGRDRIYGGGSDDTIHGNDGDDYLEGNDGNDTLWGDLGQDDLIGGTARTTSNDDATAVDGRLDGMDTLYGGDNVADLAADSDVIVGDNAIIDRPLSGGMWQVNTFNSGITRSIRFLDIAIAGAPAGAGTSGDDTIFGEANDDILYGQGSNDNMSGGTGDDRMEGNAGNDMMAGNAGNDDMVGGTGRINDDGPLGTDGRLDGSDTMHGNDGYDVMAGDNAVLVRTLVGGTWQSNTFNAGIQHETRILLDIDSPDSAIVSAGDLMFGDEKDDLMYGQGGDDEMHGNDDDDFMEGNAGVDTMTGDADEDDMIGGTVQAAVGDDGDNMSGNDHDDVMIGDNGNIVRQLIDNPGQPDDGTWARDPNTLAVIRDVFLFDVETVGASVSDAFSHGDVMDGNDGNDRMFGQGGMDIMHGGANFDYMEGNHAGDTMFGDDGEDDMIGGGSANDGIISRTSIGDGLLDDEDEMHGNAEGDVMTGDNARINRAVDNAGIWLVDPNVNDVFREVHLFDVERVGGANVDPDTSGSDLMFGNAGRDLMFGQGNTQIDDDGDGRFNEDPPDDGRDNDRDGRESGKSLVFDCLDGSDNDGDGLVDGDDPDCAAAIDEDGGGDEMHGGPGVDYMEGNHGSDWMFGDEDEDDMIGGNSAGDGVIGGGVPPTNLKDGDDTMSGNDEDDVMIGDNGTIVRPVDGVTGIWDRHVGGPFDLAVRVVTMSHLPEQEGAFGHDFMLGNDGHEDMYGQLGDDFMDGNDGEDAMVGDLGQITNRVEDGSRQRDIMIPAPFLEDTLFEIDTFTRTVELFSFLTGEGAEGNDVMLGSDGRDSLHGGPGDDFMNGDGDSVDGTDPVPETDDEDHVFGGDGDDVMWGGRSHDHLWGGHGDDHIDVSPRTASRVTAPDNALWFTYGVPDHYQGLDIIYGGFDRDAMQANEAEAGPPLADRLIDWVGGFNVFYVCPGAYGEGTITRIPSPDMREFLRDLAEADGALMPRTNGTSGFRELGYVFPQDMRVNAKPPHPDHPGHFVCDDGTVRFKENKVTGRAREPRKNNRGSSR